jgi:hypothetical protein
MSNEMPKPLPAENELPLRIRGSRASEHQGRESKLWAVRAADAGGEERAATLKQGVKTEFADLALMKENQKFYEFLKQHPDFGKFVVETLYFKARETAGDEPHAYRLQKAIEGKRLDELTDEELYGDKKLMERLLEFIDASIAIFKEAQATGNHMPDLYGDKPASNYLFNPRFSSNVIISEKPDDKGRQIFFVDTSPNSQQVKGIGKEFQKKIGGKFQIAQLENWKKEIMRLL